MSAYVKSLRLGERAIDVGGTEGKTLKEVAAEIGLNIKGNTWLVNGSVIAPSRTSDTLIRDGDRVEVAKSNDSGR